MLVCLGAQDEVLTGDSKWRTEGHGLQDARKRTLFQELPPVLQLHLGRMKFDHHSGLPQRVCTAPICASLSSFRVDESVLTVSRDPLHACLKELH